MRERKKSQALPENKKTKKKQLNKNRLASTPEYSCGSGQDLSAATSNAGWKSINQSINHHIFVKH